jgi:nucleoside 2-deoxyribosyltransferase
MRIFLSAPLTQYVTGASTGPANFREEWDALADALEMSGHEVFSAHRREAWGEKLDPPEAALPADLGGLKWCELVVAYVGDPPSPGVQLELGYALALGRELLVFMDRGQREPYLVRGLAAAGAAQLVEIDDTREIRRVLAKRGLTDPA